MHTQLVKRYIAIAALSIISLLFSDVACLFILPGHEMHLPYEVTSSWSYRITVMATITVLRSLYAFFIISGVEGVKARVKDLLQALPIYGLPAMCSWLVLGYLDVDSWFISLVSDAYTYNYAVDWIVRVCWVGAIALDFLRALLYSQAVRGVPQRAPLAVVILGFYLFTLEFTGSRYTYGSLAAYVWLLLYWPILLIQGYMVFRAEKQK